MTVSLLLRERFGLDNLADVRGHVRAAGLAAGLGADRAESLTIAAG
jgi:hypothetical protein